MIKMTGTIGGREALILGLSEGNLGLLRKGNAMHIFGAEINVPIDVIIFWGETEDKLAEMVKPLIDKATTVVDHRGTKKN